MFNQATGFVERSRVISSACPRVRNPWSGPPSRVHSATSTAACRRGAHSGIRGKMRTAAAAVVGVAVVSSQAGRCYGFAPGGFARPAPVRSAARPGTSSIHMAASVAPPAVEPATRQEPIDLTGVELSGLNGQALMPKEFPNKREVIDAIPKHCFEKDTAKALKYAALSTGMTLALGGMAAAFLPLKLAMLPAWLAYAAVTGTVATGSWVVAHECGHGAFSDNKRLQDTVGYLLHTALLVPYFSWQRSHAVHHARTNHMELGETHVPPVAATTGKSLTALQTGLIKVLGKRAGEGAFGVFQLFSHLVVGWPAYLLFGATGGPARGVTSHFFPHRPFSTGEKSTDLFPGDWKRKVWLSDVGIVAMAGLLSAWVAKAGAASVMAIYGGPYMVVNVWLVLYTWLQHTDVDIPHMDDANWSFIKGALHTVDRPYGKVLDFLHHRIGSTHVAHHVDCTIPHYHALEATEALKKAFPAQYLYDPTPIPQALWRVARKCASVTARGDMNVFVQPGE